MTSLVDMKHILLTRFALPFKADDKFYDQGRAWLDRRFELLEEYALSSVEAQTCKDFTWVLLVNEEFPHLTKDDLNRLIAYGHSVWLVDTVWDREDIGDAFDYGDELRARFPAEWYLTSRLDSDDALAPGYIAGVQATFTEEEQWIGFDNGLVFDTSTKKEYSRVYPNSPFVSLVEHRSRVRGVYQYPHTAAGKGIKYTSVATDEPGWTQVIHGMNVKNTAKRLLPKCREIV